MDNSPDQSPTVLAVSRSADHSFTKQNWPSISLVAGLGVEGDAHAGVTVKHRSRVRIDPTRPNLRQVHLIHGELLHDLAQNGFEVRPGALGENITTSGLDLLALPPNTLLRVGPSAVIQVTGLRNPCRQLDDFQNGLMRAVLDYGPEGELIRKCGIMGVVISDGEVKAGDPIGVSLPDPPHQRLEPV